MKRCNRFAVWRSTDNGESMVHPHLTKALARKLARVLQDIEDDRRRWSPNKELRHMPQAFDVYYVVNQDNGKVIPTRNSAAERKERKERKKFYGNQFVTP